LAGGKSELIFRTTRLKDACGEGTEHLALEDQNGKTLGRGTIVKQNLPCVCPKKARHLKTSGDLDEKGKRKGEEEIDWDRG